MSHTDITFNIYVMSYRRANAIRTKHHVEYCTYVVRAEEEQLYREAGVDNLLVIPQNGTLKCGVPVTNWKTTFFWIIENTPEDVIAILDDDIKKFMYRGKTNEDIKDLDVVMAEIERLAQLLVDLNLGIAYDSPQGAPYSYSGPFNMLGMISGTRIINKPCFKAQYNPHEDSTPDIDIVMQELLKNRIVLNFMYFKSLCADMYITPGGQTKSTQQHHDEIQAMKNKWGKYYDYDFKKNCAKLKVKR